MVPEVISKAGPKPRRVTGVPLDAYYEYIIDLAFLGKIDIVYMFCRVLTNRFCYTTNTL